YSFADSQCHTKNNCQSLQCSHLVLARSRELDRLSATRFRVSRSELLSDWFTEIGEEVGLYPPQSEGRSDFSVPPCVLRRSMVIGPKTPSAIDHPRSVYIQCHTLRRQFKTTPEYCSVCAARNEN